MSTRSAESRSRSPDGSPEKRVSKKRKVLSCYACRNRKMKCDRVYPVCGRCARTGRADSCTYDPRLLEDLPVNGDGHVEGGFSSSNQYAQPECNNTTGTASANIPSDVLTWKLRVQEQRLEMLEKKLARIDGKKDASYGNNPSRLEDFDAQAEESSIGEAMMFRGKGFKTQFYGSTSPLSLLSQFVELSEFTRQAMAIDTSMGRIRNDFKVFRNRRKAILKEKGPRTQGTDAEMLALIPEKSVVDAAVALYFQTFENSYRILHEPTFWRDYATFWEKRDDSPPSFATVLVLILATTKCLSVDQETIFIGDSSSERESASNLIDACDAWLARQSRKHLTLVFFQLQCLSLIAKRVNCVKMKQDWVHSGDMVRLGMASGMHRNPSFLAGGRITEYEKEMRQRIWATMMELELQASIDCGLPSSLCGLHFDTQPPSNVPDDAFSPESEQAPVSGPTDAFTSTSYLNYSMNSLPLRVHLMYLLNDPTTKLHYTDILHYDTQLITLLSSLPRWNNPHSTLPSALLDLQLRQFLLILHHPYAKLASTNPRFSYSFTACVNAANSILSLYDTLTTSGIFVLNHIRNDIFRTSMTLAQIVYHNSNFPPTNATANTPSPNPSTTTVPPAQQTNIAGPQNPLKYPIPPGPTLQIPSLPLQNLTSTTLCTSSIELLENALSIFENKLMRLGTGYMEYWLISAAIGIMPSASSTHSQNINVDGGLSEVQRRGRKAIDRITRLCFKVLALQKDHNTEFASSLRSTMATASPPETRPSISFAGVSAMGRGGGMTEGRVGGGLEEGGGVRVGGKIGEGGVGVGEIGISMPSMNGLPGVQGMALGLEAAGDGTWQGLQDMQVDMSGWSFPDFWAWDIGGEF